MAAPTTGPLAASVAKAAALLSRARQPAIAGLGSDVDGLRAAFKLGARLGALLDHAAQAHAHVELRAISDSGVMATTAAETRHRADLIVLAGPGAVTWADHAKSLADGGGLYDWRGARGVICLGTGGKRPAHIAIDGDLAVLGDGVAADRLAGLLRARLAGRSVRAGSGLPDLAALDSIALQMKSAAFGVVVIDPADFDAVGFDALQALVRDLNAETRFSSLTTPPPHHGRGAQLVSLWTTGDRLPLGLGRGYPEQDDWRFDVERAVKAGEVDALIWVAALGPALPAWAGDVPTIALLHHGAAGDGAELVIEVGVPGVTHSGTLTDHPRDGFAYIEAAAPKALPSVADVLTAFDAALSGAKP